MKKSHLVTMSALLFSVGGVTAQDSAYTKPVGYVTHTLKADQFNLIGLTVHNPIEVTGAFTFVATNGTGRVFDSGVDFSSILTDDKAYILEITSGLLAGTIQEVTRSSGDAATRLVTPDDLSADGLATGDTYQVRAADTLASVFGETNDEGLLGGASAAVSDNIYVPDGNGSFDIFYYSEGGFFGTGWRQDGAGTVDKTDDVIFMSDGFYIYKRTSDLDLVISGSVKLDDVDLAVTNDFTFVSGVYPVSSTLDSSGLSETLTSGASAATADNVLVQQDSGEFFTYYYSEGGFFGTGWRLDGGGTTDVSDVELPSAFVIRRVGAADFNAELNSPVSYSDL